MEKLFEYSNKLIKGVEKGYIVDDIENGFLNVIPLWQLDLTY